MSIAMHVDTVGLFLNINLINIYTHHNFDTLSPLHFLRHFDYIYIINNIY